MVWELNYQIWDEQNASRVEQKKKKKKKKQKKKTDAFKRCILLSLSVGIKGTFDLLDMPTAPDGLQSQCIHTCHTNRLIIRLPLLIIHVNGRTKHSEEMVFLLCLDNDVINLCCGRLPLFTCLSTIHVK